MGSYSIRIELQGGGGKPGLLGGEVPERADIRIWNWNTVAVGGKGSVYWQYAPEPAGIESPGFGLTGFRGEDTERSLAASEMAQSFNHPRLNRAVPVPARNVIYVSRKSDVLCFSSERREEMYAGSLSGVYRAAYESGTAVRFLHEDYVEELLDGTVDCLYLPMTLVLSERELAIMGQFIEQGGTLVAEACPGLYGTDGLLDFESRALNEIFGLEHKEIQAAPEWGEVRAEWTDASLGSGTFTGRFYRQLVIPGEECRIAARFADGGACSYSARSGERPGYMDRHLPLYQYEHKQAGTEDEGTRKLLTLWMDQSGILSSGRS